MELLWELIRNNKFLIMKYLYASSLKYNTELWEIKGERGKIFPKKRLIISLKSI